jgi:spermidine synthase
MPILLYALFALSGAAGLIYEAIWSRYLGLFVGHSAYAQIIVLVIFLGGMSAGAFLAGRRSARLAVPLLWYAGVEATVGVIGFVFHDVFVAITGLAYDHLFAALPGPLAVTAAKWTLAALLILPQSVLLGTTFPLMSAGVLRIVRGSTGRVLALLYFTNSLGASAGVLLAGFWLIGLAGLQGALLAAAIINMAVAIVVFVGVHFDARRAAARGAPAARPAAQTEPAQRPDGLMSLWRALLVVSFGTAVASFIYEIAWIRMLSLVLGSATHSFELMLSAFILGLALGAWWVRTRADAFLRPVRTLATIQWTMGTLAVLTLPLYLASFHWTSWLLSALDPSDAGYQLFTLARYAICLAVMLPATFCAGMTLPLITRVLIMAGGGEQAIGMVYAANTSGSILGAALAGLVLMPWIGLKALLVTGALVDMGLGLWLISRAPTLEPRAANVGTGGAGRRALLAAARATLAAGAIAAVALVVWRAGFDRSLLASGVYRFGRIPDPSTERTLFYRDGRTATVSARRNLASGTITIATNGKPDASLGAEWLKPPPPPAERQPITGDQQTQILLPLITLAHVPNAQRAAVIGEGSGMSSHILLGSPHLTRLVTIDIEPQMIGGSRVFYPANRRVFDDPRSVFAIDDAKAYFAAGHGRFDLILSEPSNPWVSGVSGLFTTEFYERVRTYLAPDGVFGQWLHLYEIDDDLVLKVLGAIQANFRSYAVFDVAGTDILIVASNRETLPVPDWSIVRDPGIAEDLAHGLPSRAEDFEAARIGARATFGPLLDRLPGVNSDYYPALDLGAERLRFRRMFAEGFSGMASERFDVAAALESRRRGFGTLPRAPMPDLPRQSALALGARLRAPANADDEGTAAARFRLETFKRLIENGAPPTDWRLWTQAAASIEGDLDGGTAGVGDTAFFASLRDYLRKARAPAEAVAGVEFLRGVAVWDFAGASRAADMLIAAAGRGEFWVPPNLLRDGTVVARLELGDVPGAKSAYIALAKVARPDSDLRSQILAARIQAAAGVP